MTHHYPSRQIRELDRMVKRYGWTWSLTKHGNVRWKGPNGQTVTTGSNPSLRSMKNARGYFQRAGGHGMTSDQWGANLNQRGRARARLNVRR